MVVGAAVQHSATVHVSASQDVGGSGLAIWAGIWPEQRVGFVPVPSLASVAEHVVVVGAGVAFAASGATFWSVVQRRQSACRSSKSHLSQT